MQARSAQVWFKPHKTHFNDGAWKPHTQISPKTQHLHNKEVVEKENSGPEEAGLFFCGTNRGPGEAPAEAPSSTAPSAPGVEQGESPQIWHRPPGEAKATAKPFHISVIQAKTR